MSWTLMPGLAFSNSLVRVARAVFWVPDDIASMNEIVTPEAAAACATGTATRALTAAQAAGKQARRVRFGFISCSSFLVVGCGRLMWPSVSLGAAGRG